MTRPGRLPLAALLTILIAGCGLSNPYQSTKRPPAASTTPTATSTSSTSTPADGADPPDERGGTIPKSVHAAQAKLAGGASASTPQAALKRYGNLYINWQATTVAARQRQLARCAGPARKRSRQPPAPPATRY